LILRGLLLLALLLCVGPALAQDVTFIRHPSSVHFNITGNANSSSGNGLYVYNWHPNTQLTHWIAAMTAAATGSPTRPATIAALGDSTTGGSGSPEGDSYPDFLATALGTNSGIKTIEANWGGNQTIAEITFTGAATWNFGLDAVGHGMIATVNAGDTGTVAPAFPRFQGTWDKLEVYVLNNHGSFTVTITGGPGSPWTSPTQIALGVRLHSNRIRRNHRSARFAAVVICERSSKPSSCRSSA
jgi:hypothetical protein